MTEIEKKDLNRINVLECEKADEAEQIVSNKWSDRQYRYLCDRIERITKRNIQLRQNDVNQVAALQHRINGIENDLQQYRKAYEEILQSTSWKITGPLRALRKQKNAAKIESSSEKEQTSSYISPLQQYVKAPYTAEKLAQLRNVRFQCEPMISILVPLYNTPKQYLTAMIDSVRAQTYLNWELCFADGSDAQHTYVGEIVQNYKKTDDRIKYQILEENKGISENTNKCIEMAIGEYVGLLDHDDLLHPAALYEYIRVINEQKADFIYCDEDTFTNEPSDAYFPHFKPDFAIDNLRANNYICHFSVFSKSLLDEAGWLRSDYDGSQDYDLVLRLTEKAKKIVHIPEVLYYWRAHAGSVALKPEQKMYAYESAKKALKAHLKRVGISGSVSDGNVLGIYRIEYEIKKKPMISIVIPNKELGYLKNCIESIEFISTYPNYEIIVIENNSTNSETFDYYEQLPKLFDNVQVVYSNCEGFNYSKINNDGIKYAKGEYILLMNNDMEVITPDWMEQMLMFAQRDDVGAVGAKLYYEDDTIQHAGVCLGLGGVGGHWHRGMSSLAHGYMGKLDYAHDVSAVTAACMLMKKDVFNQINGFDEQFAVEYNDVDLCMRIRAAGYLIVFTPFAQLYHYESKTRGTYEDPEKDEQHLLETKRFYTLWETKRVDPYYNCNLPLDKDVFAMFP